MKLPCALTAVSINDVFFAGIVFLESELICYTFSPSFRSVAVISIVSSAEGIGVV